MRFHDLLERFCLTGLTVVVLIQDFCFTFEFNANWRKYHPNLKMECQRSIPKRNDIQKLNTQNLIISRCRFAKDGYEMNKLRCITHVHIVLRFKPLVWLGSRCRFRHRMLKLSINEEASQLELLKWTGKAFFECPNRYKYRCFISVIFNS